MTDTPTWRAYVKAMVAKCQAHQDEEFYRLALPGWQAELRRLRGGDAQAPDTTATDGPFTVTQKEQHT
jgi:hypothetical protein